MAFEQNWLVGVARAEREALGRTIQYTEPAQWDLPSVSPGWRNRDIVAHLAASDVLAAAAMGGESPAELEEFVKSREGQPVTVEEFNEFSVQRRAGEPFRAVVREWGHAADLFLARVAKVPPEEWKARKVPWATGDIAVAYLVQSRVMEWWLHGEDIRQGVDLPPRLEHNPILCTNDLAIRTLPYALGLAGLSFPGRSVKIDLEAVGGGTWHRGLAAGDVPPPTKRPEALISGRAHAFAQVAGRRVPAEDFLADGVLQIDGDEALAMTVLHHVRAFA
jgi:uncharacterized protein (TIGR03083 family)